MTREELINSDEYLTATVECIVVSRKPIKKMREELNQFFLDWKAELLSGMKPNNDLPPQLNKHEVMRSAIGDDKYNSLSRLIQLHEMLNNGQGLDDEQYDEHEQLVSDLDHILPLH